jgi:hypothetical protein
MARRKGATSRRSGEPDEPLGSIAQSAAPVAPGTDRCLACGETDLVRIRMTLADGRPAVYVSCRTCEETNWFALDGDGTPVPREQALGTD